MIIYRTLNVSDWRGALYIEVSIKLGSCCGWKKYVYNGEIILDIPYCQIIITPCLIKGRDQTKAKDVNGETDWHAAQESPVSESNKHTMESVSCNLDLPLYEIERLRCRISPALCLVPVAYRPQGGRMPYGHRSGDWSGDVDRITHRRGLVGQPSERRAVQTG